MKPPYFRHLLLWMSILILLPGRAVPAGAEEEIVPPSFASARLAQIHEAGDFQIWEPDMDLQVLNSSQEKSIAEAVSGYTPGDQNLLRNQSDYFYYYQLAYYSI